MTDNAITRVEQTETPLAQRNEPTELDMMQQIIADPHTTDKASALKELVLLKEHMQDRVARVEFWKAFARAAKSIKTVVATEEVKTKTGVLMWKYAPIADIQDAIEPYLTAEGLVLSFGSEREGPLVTGLCYLVHPESGHQETRRVTVTTACAPGEMKDIGAVSMAQRKALISMFGLKIRQDDDARLVGECLLPEQIADLQARVASIGNVPVAKFLAFAGAEKWEDIRTGRLPQLYDWLRRHGAAPVMPAAPPAMPPQTNLPKPPPEPAKTAPAEDDKAKGRAAFAAAFDVLVSRDVSGYPTTEADIARVWKALPADVKRAGHEAAAKWIAEHVELGQQDQPDGAVSLTVALK